MDTTASLRTPVATVGAIYQAFGAGDAAGLLDLFDDDVAMEDHGVTTSAQAAGHPLLRLRRGKAEAAAFFAEAAALTVHEFQVHELLASTSSGTVAALVTVDFGLPNGGRYRDAEVHVWQVRDGRAVSVRHVVDTAKHLDARRGVDTTV
jgi:ketosteroid isomerase-like protein